LKILFVEPPKDVWFVMGEYLPPPYGIIQLAAYLEKSSRDVDIEVLDCNAKHIDWDGLEKHIEDCSPDIVASSSLATCNTYAVVRALETAKAVNPEILTVTGGQHFTATAQESLRQYPEIDVVVRGEGEQTLAELVSHLDKKTPYAQVKGISFKHKGRIVHNPTRPLIENLEDLPYPGYHFVQDTIHKYHFAAMAGRDVPYALVEGSRGCPYECTFCTQWQHWQRKWRTKSAERVADEIEYCYRNFGSRFIWLTDDNFGAGPRAEQIADEIIKRGIQDLTWFVQARCDDIITNKDTLPKLRKSGLNWVLLGVENSDASTLQSFQKGIKPRDAESAIKLLKQNGIFAHAMFIIGHRKDTPQSISDLRRFANHLDPDFSLFSVLTPFPGTKIYEEAKANGWIEDHNWSHYDMVHATMPTETLSVRQLQQELYECYRSFYGSWTRRFQGLFSKNEMKRRIYVYMARRGIIAQLKEMF
jgi:anaerobic magnesium-protoporphyrin IX monomethyl ester cyclase